MARRADLGARLAFVLVLASDVSRADTQTPLWQEGPRNAAVPNGYDLVFDPVRGAVVLAQGLQLYAYDGVAWKLLPATKMAPLVFRAAFAFDAKRKRLVRYDEYRETWEWDGATWMNVAMNGPKLASFADSSARMVYDESLAKVVAIGSATSPQPLATWTFDGAAWNEVISPTPPSRRTDFGVTYDVARKKVILFGGLVDSAMGLAPTNETWEWDGVAWDKRAPTTSPPARGAAIAYDIARKRTILFAGIGAALNAIPLDDTWEYDGTTWVEVHPASPPPPRRVGGVTYDRGRGRTVLFGGGNITPANDTWEYSTFGGTCASDADCNTARCDVGVCCTVACGACGRCDANGTGCLPVRSADDDSCTGPSTCDASARCKWKAGHACGLGSECASHECTHAICCGSLCAPFACNADGGCKTTCAADTDCAAPAICLDNACKLRTETCESASVSRAASGATQSCAPFACDPRAGTCRVVCASSSECSTGFSCTAGGTCASVTSSQAGCSVSEDWMRPSSSPLRWAFVLAAVGAAVLGVRRRRRWL